jgi:hypothetical protein
MSESSPGMPALYKYSDIEQKEKEAAIDWMNSIDTFDSDLKDDPAKALRFTLFTLSLGEPIIVILPTSTSTESKIVEDCPKELIPIFSKDYHYYCYVLKTPIKYIHFFVQDKVQFRNRIIPASYKLQGSRFIEFIYIAAKEWQYKEVLRLMKADHFDFNYSLISVEQFWQKAQSSLSVYHLKQFAPNFDDMITIRNDNNGSASFDIIDVN